MKAAADPDQFESFTTLLDPLPFPQLHLYLESTDGARTCLDNNPVYADLARIVYTHLASSGTAQSHLLGIFTLICCDPTCKEARKRTFGEEKFARRNGNEKVNAEYIQEFLINTPAVVLKELRDDDYGAAVVWGRVIKGEEEGAGRNELFLSLEIANAWCNPVCSIYSVFH
jgi:hypothetical protein